LVADKDTLFNERSLATDLVPNRDIGSGFARRRVRWRGQLRRGRVQRRNGLFSSTTTNLSFQDDKAFVGGMFFQPWKNTGVNALRGLGFGLAGSYEANHPNTNSATGLTPGYTTTASRNFSHTVPA
jgi:phosphate-selective porin OprO/OprP